VTVNKCDKKQTEKLDRTCVEGRRVIERSYGRKDGGKEIER